VFIIVVLKPNSRVNFGQNLSHKLGESTRVNLGQCKDKNIYFIVIKLDLVFDLGKTSVTGFEG
jgi:hypothetical protein